MIEIPSIGQYFIATGMDGRFQKCTKRTKASDGQIFIWGEDAYYKLEECVLHEPSLWSERDKNEALALVRGFNDRYVVQAVKQALALCNLSLDQKQEFWSELTAEEKQRFHS